MVTHQGRQLQELVRGNPWWRDPAAIDDDPDLRDAAELGLDYHPQPLADLEPGGLYVLRGPRRVGKTVAVKRAIRDVLSQGVPPSAVVHVAADGMSPRDLKSLPQTPGLPPLPADHAGQMFWFIDEISSARDGWPDAIKWLRDNDPRFRDATVVLTGSNAQKLSAAVGALAGRRGRVTTTDRTLLPMGFRSFARLWHPGLPDVAVRPAELRTRATADAVLQLVPWLDNLVRSFDTYLQYGGFPAAVAAARRGEPPFRWFLDDLRAVITRDVYADANIAPSASATMSARVWASLTTPLNKSNVARDVGVSPNTVTAHVARMSHAYLMWSCPQLGTTRWSPRNGSMEKVYAVDPLVARLGHLTDGSAPDPDPTWLAEMTVGVALLRHAITAGADWQDVSLFHVRTSSRKEIDFVGPTLGGVALEGKFTDTSNWRSEAATVNASEFDGVLTTRSSVSVDGADAWAVPAAMVCYLVDV